MQELKSFRVSGTPEAIGHELGLLARRKARRGRP
jgi:hypothetical protein